ncbi:MAG: hypothetical protein H6898_08680 [Rhodobacter sp.]|nr:hypothetical protein [Paracoccaceae bacterium]MCC0076650.1 hypothetical protein [Rhodobacter sp.]
MPAMRHYDDGPGFFGYLFRLIVMLLVVGGLGFVAFAYVGDLSRAPQEHSFPVNLNGN